MSANLENLVEQIRELSLEDALSVEKELKAHIDERRLQSRRQVLAQINQLMNIAGLSTDDLARLDNGRRFGDETRAPVKPKYHHPTDPSVTWTGRGRSPLWMVQWEEQGRSRDDLLIK
ncbi:H-NS histone family protein [Aquaspirillum serpens]|uniref:H-NS histone family protein n=1 Tax=Aquaspirillum serpens TaxID=190 RepID=UPI0003B578FE|nr:H-NS histone family protein [Aquaspirillum serpens]